MELLLKNGATVDPLDHWKRAPLFYAAEYGFPEIVKALLNHGANKKLKAKDFAAHIEINALHIANRKKCQEKIKEKIPDYEEVINLLK